jgi:hypothetical protein
MRAAAFAAVCVLVSAALHGLAGGQPVRPAALLGALAVAWAGAFVLGGHQRGMEVLLGACFATQYGMHHLFSANASAATPVVPSHGAGSGLGMLLVHAVTAVISAWWLAQGESVLAILLHLAVASIGRWWRILPALTAGLPVEAGRRRLPSWDELRGPFPHFLLAAAIPRRGPPARFSLPLL